MSETSSLPGDGERIAKVLARAGVCSRRDAERLIADGRVAVEGKRLDTPAFKVTPGMAVTVDGKPIPETEPARLWRFHKPTGLVTTHRDPEGRPTVFSVLPKTMPRVISVGRLDVNSEGLLLLTNDGELARKLELPSTGWLRRYRVRVFGRVEERDIEKLLGGVEFEGIRYQVSQAKLDRVQGDNSWLSVGLREGKNREIRKLMEVLGLRVNRLIRISYGPFQLGDLASGTVDEVSSKVLAEQMGQATAKDGRAKPKKPKPAPGAKRGAPRGAKPAGRPPQRAQQTRSRKS